MKPISFKDESFMGIEVFGKQGLFTNMRINRDTVPDELYAYDCRDGDCDGCICEITNYVLVNHWGTVFFLEPIENFVPKDSLYLNERTGLYSAFVDEKTDVNYLDDGADPYEFIANKRLKE